jgi:HAMP domain-containing protein
MQTLRQKIFLLVLGVYALIGIAAFAAFNLLLTHLITEHIGRGYVGKYALANTASVQEPLAREIVLARQLAASPVIRRWVMNEQDPTLHQQAMGELESFRQRLAEASWFVAIDSSRHYYFNDLSNSYAGRELVYSLSPDQTKDAWYFATLQNVRDYALNVNYDNVLDVHKVWINVVMKTPDGTPIGVAGTGLDLSGFLKSFTDHTEPGVEHILLDQRLAIQAHHNRSLIDHHSLAKTDEQRSTIRRIITNPDDLLHLDDALAKLKGGSREETFRATLNGKPVLVGVAGIKDLDWIELTLLDPDQVLRHPLFIPLFALSMVIGLLLMAITGTLLNRVVLKPLTEVTAMARRISAGDYSQTLPSDRRDEIGTLNQVFSEMSAKIRENTETLESRIRERTSEIDKAHRDLQVRMDELREAHANVRTLGAMLPICCSCKKIRDDKGYWNQLEIYIRDHAGTEFSHGICPDCQKKLYPEPPSPSTGKATPGHFPD